MKKVLAVLVVTLWLPGCATLNVRSQPPSDIARDSLNEGAVFIGSILMASDKTNEMLFLWSSQYAADGFAKYKIRGETFVPTTGLPGAALSYFAVTELEGPISFSSSETARAVSAASRPVHIGNTVLIKNYSPAHLNEWVTSEAVGRGNLVYVGRFVCLRAVDGCEWRLVDESETDIPVLKKLNPRLP